MLVWQNHEVSRSRSVMQRQFASLGFISSNVTRPSIPYIQDQLAAARKSEGTTVFDWLIEIIAIHELKWRGSRGRR